MKASPVVTFRLTETVWCRSHFSHTVIMGARKAPAGRGSVVARDLLLRGRGCRTLRRRRRWVSRCVTFSCDQWVGSGLRRELFGLSFGGPITVVGAAVSRFRAGFVLRSFLVPGSESVCSRPCRRGGCPCAF